MRFVLVPMSVHMPPRIAAYESGMSRRDAARWMRRDQSDTSGSRIVTMGVLLRKALATVTGIMRRICALIRRFGQPSRGRTAAARMPVSPRPAATTNMAATVTMPSLEKPASAAPGVTIPPTMSTATPPRIERYGGTRVAASNANTPTTTTVAAHAWGLIAPPA